MQNTLHVIIILAALFKLANTYLIYKKAHPSSPEYSYQAPSETSQDDAILSGDGTVTISGDDNGQFVTDVTINGVTMQCLIDTGATTTSIPFDLAQKARLPIGQLNTASTANGLATTVSSGAQSLILGDNELFNVEVDVLYNLNITLVGMNVLRRFQITTSGNTMTLVPRWRSFAKNEGEGANGDGGAVVAEAGSGKSAGTVRLPTGASAHGDSSGKKVAEWRKSVVCDDDGDCRTRYSR